MGKFGEAAAQKIQPQAINGHEKHYETKLPQPRYPRDTATTSTKHSNDIYETQ